MTEKQFLWKTVWFEDRLDEELQSWVSRSEDQLNGHSLIRRLAYDDSKTGKRVYLVIDLLSNVCVYWGCSPQERDRVWAALRDDYVRLARYHARMGVDVILRVSQPAPVESPAPKRRRVTKKKIAQLVKA